jgi:hypothetical protein
LAEKDCTLKNSALFNLVFGALVSASLFYVGILVLLLSLQRFGCCPIFLNN